MTYILFLVLVITVEVSGKFHSLSPSQIIELEEDEPKLFTKTSKNKYYIKRTFLTCQKANKKKL